MLKKTQNKQTKQIPAIKLDLISQGNLKISEKEEY